MTGGDFTRLREADIEVFVGLRATEARDFFKRLEIGQPLVVVADNELPFDGQRDLPASRDASLVMDQRSQLVLSVREEPGSQFSSAIEDRTEVLEVLRELGARGLTSILVRSSDPLAHRLRAAGLVDQDLQ